MFRNAPRFKSRLLGIAMMVIVAPTVPYGHAASRPSGQAAWVEFLPAEGEPGDAPITTTERQALVAAGEIANAVKNSDCFATFLARRRMIDTKGRTAPEIAAQVQALGGTVPVAFYFRCNNPSPACTNPTAAVAYRQPPQGKIFINRAHFDAEHGRINVYELAGTLAHEGFGHLLGGYDHAFAWTPDRDFSVPYSISGASPENDDAFQHCRGAGPWPAAGEPSR